ASVALAPASSSRSLTSSGLAELALLIARRPLSTLIFAWTRDTKRFGSGRTSVLTEPRPMVPPSEPNTAAMRSAGATPWYETTDISYTFRQPWWIGAYRRCRRLRYYWRDAEFTISTRRLRRPRVLLTIGSKS